jgi:hypothetical protein
LESLEVVRAVIFSAYSLRKHDILRHSEGEESLAKMAYIKNLYKTALEEAFI